MIAVPGSKLDSISPLEKILPVVGRSVHRLEIPQSNLVRVQAERQSIGGEGISNVPRASWKPMDHDLKLWSDLCAKPASYSLDGEKNLIHGFQHESSLFSSSLSDIFCRKCKLLISCLLKRVIHIRQTYNFILSSIFLNQNQIFPWI